MRRIRRIHVVAAALTAALCVPASGVSSAASGPSMITKIGKNEGALNLIAWEGYTQPQWVKPFTKSTDRILTMDRRSAELTISINRSTSCKIKPDRL